MNPSKHAHTSWPGRDATGPTAFPVRAWRSILGRVYHSIGDDNLPLLAAGLAFYAMLAIFPGLIAAITIYGLVADPGTVSRQLALVTDRLSGGTGQVLSDQLTEIVSSSHEVLGWSLVAALATSLWSASTGTLNLLKAVNLAYDETETRGWFKLRGIALLLTAGAVLFVLTAVTLIAVLPAVIGFFGLGAAGERVVTLLRWPLLLAIGLVALTVVYRLGPDRRSPRLRWTAWGSAAAMAVWLAASWGFSYYVENFGSYNETYGSLGGVVILLMWFFVTAFSVLLGAEIGAEMELQTGVDTTVGGESGRGERGAVKADRTPLEGEHRAAGSAG